MWLKAETRVPTLPTRSNPLDRYVQFPKRLAPPHSLQASLLFPTTRSHLRSRVRSTFFPQIFLFDHCPHSERTHCAQVVVVGGVGVTQPARCSPPRTRCSPSHT